MADRGFFSALANAIRALGAGKSDPEAAQEASEEASKKLPKAVMPREAVLKQRSRMQQLDDIAKE